MSAAGETAEAVLAARLRQTQRLLRRQTARFAAMVDAVGHGFAMFDNRKRLIACNPAFLTTFGLPVSCARTGTSLARILDARIAAGTQVGDDEASFISETMALAETAHAISRLQQLRSGDSIAVSFRPMPDGGFVWTQHPAAELAATPSLQPPLVEPAAAGAEVTAADIGLALLDGLEPPELPVTDDPDSDATEDADDLMAGFAAIADDLEQAPAEDADIGEDPAGEPVEDIAALVAEAEELLEAGPGAAAVAEPDAEDAAPQGDAVLPGDAIGDDPMMGLDGAIGPELPDETVVWAEDLASEDAGLDDDAAPVAADAEMAPEASPLFVSLAALEDDMRQGLADGQFSLHYQPILDMASQQIAGFEALLRWAHPAHGDLTPGDYLELAEAGSAIAELNAWVMRTALVEAARWPARYRVAVNVSPAQFKLGDLPGLIPDLLGESGVAAERLELEFTDSLFLADAEASLETLKALRGLGVRLALDDFCAGQSSIRDVLAFDFDRIKIDGEFIRLADGKAPAVVRAFVELGEWLAVPVTAEGIETAEQLRAVHGLGYAEAQGFLIARPVPRAALAGLIGDGYGAAAPDLKATG